MSQIEWFDNNAWDPAEKPANLNHSLLTKIEFD